MASLFLDRSEVLERFDSLGQVAEELGHARGEERVDHRAGQESPQVRLEEREHLGAVGLPGGKHIVNTKSSSVFTLGTASVGERTRGWGRRCIRMDG